ncbi:sialidase family protein [Sorangium sp. So ce375]|uniref:sialidase family protein n=1 Tax=Sorangium sp. So ce375 TaxID=3133306 RepID=UPI003F5C0BDC
MQHPRIARHLGVVLYAHLTLGLAAPAFAQGGDTLVSVGRPDSPFSQNKQNEPAVAVDANHPNVVAAGANDLIDLEACKAGDPTTCPFTQGVGTSGVYFSFDSGQTWTQPTYRGWTARNCLGPGECTPDVGPIGTLPKYYENGLVSDGDPAVAFGPRPGPNGFSWNNGSRLYYANLTANFSAERGEQAFRGFEAVAVSRIDGDPALTPEIVADQNNWLPPVIASQRQSSTTFSDKEQIWADNAESSPFFGNVYVCFAQFRGQPGAAAPLTVIRSTDGGDTWEQKQVTPAHNVPSTMWGQSGCTIRTDSTGVVYVFYEQFQSPFRFLPPHGAHMLVKSFDGGRSFTRPRELFRITDPCFFVDPVIGRCVMDGIAGARNDLAGSPSVDIANGAPTGDDATDEIVDTWVDGRDGLNFERVMLSHSTDGGATWSGPTAIQSPGDRGYYTAPALSPDGTDLYIVYNAFLTPFRNNTTDPRSLVGVVLHADIGAGGAPTGFSELHRGASGDPRGSSQNDLVAEFLGDYVYAAATRDFGVAVWNDVRDAADCPAIDAFRQSLSNGGTVPTPRPNTDCPLTFGNSDIFGGSFADPTP